MEGEGRMGPVRHPMRLERTQGFEMTYRAHKSSGLVMVMRRAKAAAT
jgi:hypothetical protein